jgi:tetratricopeptide (TPR) repeat protein
MSNNSDFEFFDGMVSYKRAEYQLAIEKWQNLLADKPQNDTLNYFLGVAYLAEKNQLKTIEFLTKVAGDSNSIFFKDVNFYLGLAYLKNDDIEKSIQSFNISNTEKSQQIISNLKKKK